MVLRLASRISSVRSSSAAALTPSSQEAVGHVVLDHLGVGELEVVRRNRRAVAPAGVGAKREPVRASVVGDGEALGEIGLDVEVAPDRDEPTEEIARDLARQIAGYQTWRRLFSGPPRRGRPGDPLARLQPRRHGCRSDERLAEGFVRGVVVEGEVVGERDLEQRLAGPRLVAGSLHEAERAPVELDRLLLCVDRAGGVARLQQVLDRTLGLVGLGEVVGEQPVDLRGRVAVELDQCLADAAGGARAGGPRRGFRRRPPARARGGSGTRAQAPLRLLDHELEPLELGEGRQQPRPREEPLEQG